MIFFYVNFDKCRKEIVKYENKRNTNSVNKRHPKESKKEALDLLRCHSKKYAFFCGKNKFEWIIVWNLNQYVWSHSMMQENVCSRWMGCWEYVNLNWTCSKNVCMTQSDLKSSRDWQLLCKENQRTIFQPSLGRTTSCETTAITESSSVCNIFKH